jgi:cytochrome P450
MNASDFSDLGERFDPWEDGYLRDPYPFFKEARERTPIFWSPRLESWVVTRYSDIKAIFNDPSIFSASNVLSPVRPVCPAAAKVIQASSFKPVRVLTDNDPPSHTRARQLASVAFTPRRVAAMEPFIRQLVDRFIQQRFSQASGDLIRDLAWDLPVLVIFRMLGVPDEDVEDVKAMSGNRMLFLWGQPTDDEQVELATGLTHFWQYARELVAKRAAEPKDDFTSDLLAARSEGLPAFTHDEVTSTAVILLAAGHETTTGLLGNAMRQFLQHSGCWGQLREEPRAIPGAIEEVLRYDSPVVTWRRKTLQATSIAGTPVPAGANVMMLTGSGNRDPEAFDDPETFDIRRAKAKSHLAFGFGPHFCLGAPMARLEARIVFEELTRRLPEMRLLPEQDIRFVRNTTFRAPICLQAEWGPAKSG